MPFISHYSKQHKKDTERVAHIKRTLPLESIVDIKRENGSEERVQVKGYYANGEDSGILYKTIDGPVGLPHLPKEFNENYRRSIHKAQIGITPVTTLPEKHKSDPTYVPTIDQKNYNALY